MDNMRSYSLAFYPETKKRMEAIKNEKQLTWDELFNYFMASKNEEKGSEEKLKSDRKDDEHGITNI